MADAEVVVVAEGVIIPNVNAIFDQILDVCIALQKPQQLVDNSLQEYTLCGEQRPLELLRS